ncbi:MAG: N-6 DNA methylase, partial [Nitrosopumilus sp.]|nr:N-6 DNA methylase [Nitrosopumilus sp.]
MTGNTNPGGERAAKKGRSNTGPRRLSNMTSKGMITQKAKSFVGKWKDRNCVEKKHLQEFWRGFFEIFDRIYDDCVQNEEDVYVIENSKKSKKWIDLLWKGVLLVEQKSPGKDLDRALNQAMQYYHALDPLVRPKYVIACDFKRFEIVEVGSNKAHKIVMLEDVPDSLASFDFMAKGESKTMHEQKINQKAAYEMDNIYKKLVKYDHDPEVLNKWMTRLAYCMFAEDAGIFKKSNQFSDYIEKHTRKDGHNLGNEINRVFDVLKSPKRAKNLPGDLEAFEYINGGLFEESLAEVHCDEEIRKAILAASEFSWHEITPSIFGSMFEGIMDKDQRRETGSHYTTTENVLKVINPLFMDSLRAEYEGIMSTGGPKKTVQSRLAKFQDKLAGLRFLDPACGSGSFLITTYKELRQLEFKVIESMYDHREVISSTVSSKVDVNQFYGIELNPFAARITEAALWMADHQENMKLHARYEGEYLRIPLTSHATIHVGDALEVDWNDVLPSGECDYIIGNPPFGGPSGAGKTNEQSARITGHKKIDYVANWFVKSAKYVRDDAGIGLVATNSIVQGEQVGKLWPTILDDCGMSITFAHDSFKWKTDAKGGASVIVVIIGMSKSPSKGRRLYDEDGGFTEHAYISPYLKGFTKQMPIVHPASKPLNGLAPLIKGTQPNEGNETIFTEDEMLEFIKKEPGAEPLMREFVSGKSFIQGQKRWILDARNLEPSRLKTMKHVMERLEAVSKAREKSPKASTRKLARTPAEWEVTVVPTKQFLGVPEVSSENREYIPIGFLEPPAIP